MDVAAPAVAQPKGVRLAIVVAVVLSAVLEVLDSTIVNVALPHISAAFGASTDQTTWILTSYIVAAVVIMPLTGVLARRVGRRNLILTAITGFVCFSMLCGLSTGLEMIVACRMGQGVFGAFLIPLSQSILFDAFPREKRGQSMAMFGLGVVVAPVLGPTLGAVLTEYFSWRMVFFVNLPVAAFALMMLAGELPKDRREDVRIDYRTLVLMALGIGALQFTLDQGTSLNWLSSHVIQVAIMVAVLGGVAFLWRSLRQDAPLVDVRLFAERNFGLANLVIAGFAVSMFGGIAILPLFLQGLLGYPVIEAGMIFIPRGLAAAVATVLVGAVLVNRMDPRLLGGLGLVLLAISNFMMASMTLEADFWQLAWPGVFSGLGMGLVFVPMSTLAFDRISSARQDEASGLFSVTRQLGSSIGIAIVGAILVNQISTSNAILGGSITPYDPAAYAYLSGLGLTPQSTQGAALMAGEVARQAELLAYTTVFRLLGWTSLVLVPLVALMQKPLPGAAKPVAV
ncbi:MFS transporter, DHA2 family, multidrug resistance protein [Devosia sp. YR412]|uniref:DHA2 family efflux MFS transporter permease subunit n=1 Tax=Devosia sp. YR412 TaxID=1881030 RepID=UPI0008C34FBA|nr:DHA2 family efflux MFS transporter permease subunit [Devosia sp. YR412]SEP77081.1 MFS transporter, DHA2 family, multidrug resistance protein [Devosia sp. YR412]